MSEWYEVVEAVEPLTQGDLIFDCPVPNWKSGSIELRTDDEVESLKSSLEFISADVVVLTQACDLAHHKVENITLCGHLSLTEFKKYWEEEARAAGINPTAKAWKKQCDSLKDGFAWNLSLLNKFSSQQLQMDYRVIDFHHVFTIPRTFLEDLIRKRSRLRARLLPPYREHVSQAFARFYMRVGLPHNIRIGE